MFKVLHNVYDDVRRKKTDRHKKEMALHFNKFEYKSINLHSLQ